MNGAVLWDLDGTLVDSEEYHWLSWRDTMAAEGFVLSYTKFLESFGQKNDRILTAWLGADTPADRIQQIGDRKEAEYRRLARERGLVPLPGAAEWLGRLHDAGWKQAIASSAPRENVEVVLEGLSLTRCFEAVTSAEDVTAGKPDPQVFLKAAGKLHMPPSRCIVVEDVAAGVEAARRAGMRCIGVNRTSTLNADIYVRSLDELPADAFDKLRRLTTDQRLTTND